MRRLISYFIIFIAAIVIQFIWMRYFSPFGLSPNLILVLIIFVGITRGPFTGQIFGFCWGIAWDVISVGLFGSHALLFTCAGYLSGLLSRKWNEDKIITQLIVTGAASALFLVGMGLVYRIFGLGEFEFKLNYIKIFQPFYNIIIAPLVFWSGSLFMEYVDRVED